jgi:hypothetical protein
MSMGYGRTKAQNWLSCIYTANYCTPAVLEKACFPVDARFGDDNIKSLSARPRKRMLQCLPSPLLVLLNQCREMELSRV